MSFVHRWIPGRDPAAATLLMLHGTGGDENDLLGLGRMLAPGAAILSPRGQVLEHGMPRFFRRLAEGVFDEEDLERRTDELSAFLREASVERGFAIDRVTAVGYSNGANIAASLLMRDPDLLRSAVLFRAMTPFEPGESHPIRARVLVLSGRHDPIIPAASAARLVELLRERGARVEHHLMPSGHELTREDVDLAQSWLGQA